MNENKNNLNEDELAEEEAAAMDAANDAAAEDAAAADAVRIEALSAALSGNMEEEEPELVSVDDERVLELEAQIAELRDSLLRAMAETENIRKRGERQMADAHKYAVTGFARDILSIADNLERALDAVPEERRGEHELLGMLLEGVMAVQAGFLQTMATNKIERLVPLGEPFDPNLHEAMYEIPGTDYPDGTVAQVMEPGYRLHERLLRPARVGVAKSANGGKPVEPKVDTTA
ncbi:MAG: nucleotide exchange factor GrpE [Alphaproteobacteria bacterium]|nr:nucleotide exchange factor GrpE [Alphaproteobacteria bacterium]